MVEFQVAIVHVEVPELHTDVADFNSRKRLVCLIISDRHEEGQNAIVTLIDNAASKHDGMCSLNSKVTWPELGRFKRWCMDFKLLILKVEDGRSLQTCHIRAMTKLSLCVAANYLPVIYLRHPVTYLLFITEHKDALGEHLHMECHGVCTGEMVVPVPIPALFVSIVRDQVTELFILHNNLKAVPPDLHFLRLSHFIVRERCL